MNFELLYLEIATFALALVVLLVDLFVPRVRKECLGYVAAAGLALILLWSIQLPSGNWQLATSQYMFLADGFALFFRRLFLSVGIVVCVMSVNFARQIETGVGEFFALILMALTGMMLAATANDFVLLFVSVELITVIFYILTSYLRRRLTSLEAGVKYLILGALSSALLVYGIAFVFGVTGAMNFGQIAAHVKAAGMGTPLTFGLVLVLAGLTFKIAAVPFQIWAPDVYQGAPAPATAFLAVGSKAAGFVLLLRVLFGPFGEAQQSWTVLISALAAVTILYGNLGAIPQRNLKRLLAYSSIGHAGFLLMGVAAASALGTSAVLFYLAAYVFTNLGAFLVIVLVSNATGQDDVEVYRGLASRAPFLAAAMTVAMASLAGVPPLAGFFGKLLVFMAALDRQLYWLVAVGLLGVAVSLYFYLGIVRAMFWEKSDSLGRVEVGTPMRVTLWLVMLATIFIGVFQNPLMRLAVEAAASLGLK